MNHDVPLTGCTTESNVTSGRAQSVDRQAALKAKVNVDSEPAVSAQLGVQGIATMVLYRGGIEVARPVGALPVDRIRQWVERSLR